MKRSQDIILVDASTCWCEQSEQARLSQAMAWRMQPIIQHHLRVQVPCSAMNPNVWSSLMQSPTYLRVVRARNRRWKQQKAVNISQAMGDVLREYWLSRLMRTMSFSMSETGEHKSRSLSWNQGAGSVSRQAYLTRRTTWSKNMNKMHNCVTRTTKIVLFQQWEAGVGGNTLDCSFKEILRHLNCAITCPKPLKHPNHWIGFAWTANTKENKQISVILRYKIINSMFPQGGFTKIG